MHGYGYGSGGHALFLFAGLLSFLLLVAGVVLIVGIAMRATRRGSGWGHGRHPGAPGAGWGAPGVGGVTPAAAGPSAAALGILEERLARGEIDIEAYRSLRAELTRTDPGPG